MADTRKDKRTAVALKVRFKSATVDEFIEQYSTDLSRGGIFVKSGRPMKVGTLLKFQFQLKDESSLIRGVGRVVWTREEDSDPESPPGMGIKFIKMDESSKEVLERVLSGDDDEKRSRFDVGPGLGKVEAEPPGAHPSDPPEGSFFPSTSSEDDLPPPEDRTAIRHASEFLAGALSGVEDPDAAREAEASAEQARKRSEQIDLERAEAAAEAYKSEQPSMQPSIVVDPTLESERPAPPEDDEFEDAEEARTTAYERPADPERDIDTEVGTTEQLERLARERAERKQAQQQAAEEALKSGPVGAAAKDEEHEARVATQVMTPEESSSGKKGLLVALLLIIAAVFVYLSGSSDEPAATPAEATEPAPAPVEPVAAEPAPEEPAQAVDESPTEPDEVAEEEAEETQEPSEEEAASDEPAEDEPEEAEPEASEDGAEPDTSAPDEGAGLIKKRVVTIPPGGEVFVAGESKGKAPLTVELPEGSPVELRAKLAGRQEVVREITAAKGTKPYLRLVLPRLPYVLSVVSKPEGALAIAGTKRVETPGELNLGIPAGGRIRVLVRAPGYVQARRYVLVGQFEESDGAMRETLEVELTENKRATRPPVPTKTGGTAPAPKQEAAPEDETPAQAEPKPAPAEAEAEAEEPAPEPAEEPAPEPAPAAEPEPAPSEPAEAPAAP